MRRVGIDVDVIRLAVTLQGVAQAPDVVDRDEVIGLAEHAEHRARDGGDDLVERPRIFAVGLPLARLGGTVPDQRGADRARRREHERQARGLAHAHHGEPRHVGLRHRGERIDHRVERAQRVRVAHVAPGVAAMQRLRVGVPEIEVGRDRHVSVAGKTLGELADVPHQPVTLVDHDDGGRLCDAFRRRDVCRHVAAHDAPGADAIRDIAGAAHFFATSARKLGSMKPASAGGVANSPIATRASIFCCRPSVNSAASGAITCWRT